MAVALEVDEVRVVARVAQAADVRGDARLDLEATGHNGIDDDARARGVARDDAQLVTEGKPSKSRSVKPSV